MPYKHITVSKTARYAIAGTINASTKNIWMTLHGYAQDAENFISQFQPLAEHGDYIIAPEALSRFYTKGFFGNVGASWMTKEDREYDIADNNHYLQKLYENEIARVASEKTIHLLGFSQGSTTLCRYVSYMKPTFHHLWVCAGDVPEDLNWENFKALTDSASFHLLLGKNDTLVTTQKIEECFERLKRYKIQYSLHEFDGGHEIDLQYLLNVSSGK